MINYRFVTRHKGLGYGQKNQGTEIRQYLGETNGRLGWF